MTIFNRRGLLKGLLLLPFVPAWLRPKDTPEVVEALEFFGGLRIERLDDGRIRYESRGVSAISILHNEATNRTSVVFPDDCLHEARIGWGSCKYGDLTGLPSDPQAFVHVQWSVDRKAKLVKTPFWLEVKPCAIPQHVGHYL